MTAFQSFSVDYSEAREKFLAAAHKSGATMLHYENGTKGPRGEAFFADVACATGDRGTEQGSVAEASWKRVRERGLAPRSPIGLAEYAIPDLSAEQHAAIPMPAPAASADSGSTPIKRHPERGAAPSSCAKCKTRFADCEDSSPRLNGVVLAAS